MDPKSGGLTKGWDSNYVGGGFLARWTWQLWL